MMNKKNTINLMHLPALILFVIFVVIPFIDGIRISFTNWNGFSQNYKYIGFNNYKRFFTDGNVRTAFINTIIYGVGSTIIQNIIGLAYALFLNSKFKGRNIVRTVIYMPVMIAGLIMGYIFYFVVQYDGGALNDILILLNKEPVDWMANGTRAVWIMTLINSMQFVGIAMVIYLAGLQSISKMYYEAAQIDGASKWKQLINITIPLLIPAITSSFIINIIGGLKLFDIIMALTAGGPGFASHSLSTLVTYTYFRGQNAGYSATIGLFTFIFIMFISIFTKMYLAKKEVEY